MKLPMLFSNDDRGEPTVVIAGGGTGGHVFPGISLAQSLENKFPNLRIVFVGTQTGLEAEVVPRYGFELRTMSVPTLKGGSRLSRLRRASMLPVSALQAIQLLRGLRPSCIVSVGGYAAGPVAALGGLLGISTVLLEQNSVPGMTNRLLDRVASHAFLSFDRSASHFKHAECHIVGTPVRDDILELRDHYTYECSSEGPFRVLVLGGSGGAGSLNERLPETLTELQSGERGLRVRHQCGRGRKTPVEDAYRSFSGELEIVEFIDDMPAAYRDADLLICRAGASTISEILTVGLPAVFVPFPEAADDHQTKNARAVAEAGAGIELADKDLGTGRATRLLQGLINNPVSLRNIAERARRIGKPDAAENIAEIIGRRILKPKAIV